MEQFISRDLIDALGWTVLHSLWQAMLVALLMAGIMIVLQSRRAKLRYYLANTSLLLVVGLAIYTFWSIYFSSQAVGATEGVFLITEGGGGMAVGASSAWAFFEEYFNAHLPLIVVIWLMGMVLFLLRMLGGLAYVEYIKNRYTKEMPEDWQLLLKTLYLKLNIKRKVGLLESALVHVPLVVGWAKPVILIPIGAINGLTKEQVEAVLAHELAHISRHDFLFNIIQSIVEVMFYFNPAVWWISANIRMERENCCDDDALELCGDRLAYAKALVVLQEQKNGRYPMMAMAFSANKKQLLKRISRILNHPQNKSRIMEKLVITSLLLISMVVLSSSANIMGDKNEEIQNAIAEEAPSIHDDGIVEADASAIFVIKEIAKDSLPKGKNRLIVDKEGQKMEVEIEDGKIKTLKIDGEEIPESEFAKHKSEVETLWSEMPEVHLPETHSIFELKRNKKERLEKRLRHRDGRVYIGSGDKVELLDGHEGDENVFFFGGDGDDAKAYVWTSPDLDFDTNFDFPNNIVLWNDAIEGNVKTWNDSLKNFNFQFKGMNEEQMMHLEGALEKQGEALRRIQGRELIIVEGLAEKHAKLAELQTNHLFGYAKGELFPRVESGGVNGLFWHKKDNQKGDMLIQHLIADGLIKNMHKYKVELSGKHLKINGKKQSKTNHKKYLKLYESLSGFEMSKKSKIIIEKD